MTDAENLLAQARKAQQAADRNKAQADAALAALKEQLTEAVSKLQEMGYTSPQQAQEDAVRLRTEATEALTDVLSTLQGVGV